MKRTIFVAALLLAGASSPVFASEKDGACTCGDSHHHAMSEKKGTEPEDVGGGRGEPQRAQEQAAKQQQQQQELTSTQRKVLADWRSVEQLQQRVP
jgi:hypothetical protein